MDKIKITAFFSFFLVSLVSFSQIVEEIIQIDTITETIKVIYRPTIKTAYYFKKVAVFADDTSQIAIEKSFTSYGQNGLYKVYYPNGRLKVKTVFANDKINGEWTYYGLDGIIITKGIYKGGVKHGYWAYKSLKIYGRYKKGLKNKKWKRFDENQKKYLSHYNNGTLTGGEGYAGDEKIDGLPVKRNIFTAIFPKRTKNTVTDSKNTSTKEESIQEFNEEEISKEYQQVITFLTENGLFRRTIKKYSGGSIAKYFKKDKFQFAISPSTYYLNDSLFYSYLKEGKISVALIDSVLRFSSKETLGNGAYPESKIGDTLIDYSFDRYSTNKESPVTIYLGEFGKTNQNLMRVDVVWKKKAENQKFRILLYFDDEGILKGAEYEKP